MLVAGSIIPPDAPCASERPGWCGRGVFHFWGNSHRSEPHRRKTGGAGALPSRTAVKQAVLERFPAVGRTAVKQVLERFPAAPP